MCSSAARSRWTDNSTLTIQCPPGSTLPAYFVIGLGGCARSARTVRVGRAGFHTSRFSKGHAYTGLPSRTKLSKPGSHSSSKAFRIVASILAGSSRSPASGRFVFIGNILMNVTIQRIPIRHYAPERQEDSCHGQPGIAKHRADSG